MMRLVFLLAVLANIACLSSCEKNSKNNEEIFLGTWIKGTNAGDTIWFMSKSNQFVMRYNMSFNAALLAYVETEYRFRNDKLEYKTGDVFTAIDSFKWNSAGKEFDILGFQLYRFMSSSGTHFTFRRIN